MAEPPGSTYRLQLHADFGFAAAAELADYLAALGVTHVYLSPILQAAPGSPHGYDVVDHSRISAELGGESGFRAMVEELRRHGLGIVVDIVPNHMGIGAPQWQNRQFWSVLADGAESSSAHWFDIDWAARGGRLLLPILAGPPVGCAADLVVDRGGLRELAADLGPQADAPVLRYFEHVLPLRPGTADLPLPELLAAQHYELADWRTAATDLNWRRFFDITGLIGIQVQEPDVFAATHGLLLGLVAQGLIDGLRVDHPDGLADPRGYLARLATGTSGAWVVTEKILTGDERLPADWDCAGTTGYDSLRMVGGLFTDPAGAEPLTREYVRFTSGSDSFEPVAQAAKREIITGSLAAEISRLVRVTARALDSAPLDLSGSQVTEADLSAVLGELVAGLRVYRTYVLPGEEPSPESAALLGDATAAARDRLPGRLHPVLDAVAAILLKPGTCPAARAELVVRFQQTSGPVMAKGIEDTAFYRWSRLSSRNEVGGEPARLAVSPAEFHAFAARLAQDWPATMTTLSTHDTKRGEDVRARLAVLTERPAKWAAQLAAWHKAAGALAGPLSQLPEPETEYLLWQTLAGAWPLDEARLSEYLRKAMREAKTRTSWAAPDADYENAVTALAAAVLADPGLSEAIAGFVAEAETDALANSLGAKLVQLTMPGVPDVYQGCELGSFPLVDPDNRRPVDFSRRRALLFALNGVGPEGPGSASAAGSGTAPAVSEPAGSVTGGSVTGGSETGGTAPGDTEAGDAEPGGALLDRQKLLVTARALRLRRDHPDWFTGSYAPLAAEGPAAEHALAFARGGQVVALVTRLPAGLRRRGGWADTELPMPQLLPGGPPRPIVAWRDVLTNTLHTGPRLVIGRLTEQLPVALLVPVPVASRPDHIFKVRE